MQIIRRNFGLKVLSVALAIVGWAYFRFATNPIVAAAHFDQQISLPITTANVPSGTVVHYTERDAVVTVESKPGAPAVKPDEIRAVLDLSNKGPGVYNVPVQLVAPDVAVQSLSPASVTLTIEPIQTRDFPPIVYYTSAQSGVVVEGQHVVPRQVTVQGPSSALGEVAAVRLDVSMPSAAGNVDEMVRPSPVNASGDEVSGVQVSPDLVRVRMQFVAAHGVSGHP